MATTIDGSVHVTGNLSADTLSVPDQAIDDDAIAPDANVSHEKHQHQFLNTYSQPNTTATSETRTLLYVHGSEGAVLGFVAGTIGVCTVDATITVDLKLNGTSILTAPIALDSASVARIAEAGVVASPELIAGDWLEIVVAVTAAAGAPGSGLFVSLWSWAKAT